MACKKNKRLVPTLLICVGMMLPVCAKAETSGVTVVTEQQQSKQIRIVGIVKDEKGEPAIGVSVLVKGTTSGTITDMDGNFVLNAPGNATLVFSFVGYKPQEVKINNRASIDVTLVEDAMMLDEVVAVGYGS